MKSPKISIIMATYNSEKYLSKTVESILKQSFNDFEFIIINDCSEDGTYNILSKYNDKRIKVIDNNVNLGLYKSLNVGFKESSGNFIARIDADDIASSNRLQVQYDYLINNPSIGLVGCNYYEIDKNGEKISGLIKFHQDPIILKWRMSFENPIPSPVLFRRDVYLKVGGFDERSKVGMDYDFFSKAIKFGKISNIQEPVMYWRVHDSSISSSQGEFQLKNAKEVSRNYVNDILNEKFSLREIDFLWERDKRIYNKIKFSILYRIFRKILSEKEWSVKEKKKLKEYVVNYFIFHFKIHIKKPFIVALMLKTFFLSPVTYMNVVRRKIINFNYMD